MVNRNWLILIFLICVSLLFLKNINASDYGYDSLVGNTLTSQTIIINGSAIGGCPSTSAIQNLTGTGVQCIALSGASSFANFSSFNTTQMFYSGGFFNILESWLKSVMCSLSGGKYK